MRDRRAVVRKGVFVTVLILQCVILTTVSSTFNHEASQIQSRTQTNTQTDAHPSYSHSSSYAQSISDTSTNSRFESSYLLVAPSFIRSNMIYNIAVYLPKANGTCRLTAVITPAKRKTLVAGGRGTFDDKQSALLSIKIPNKIPDVILYKLEVKSYGGLNFTANYTLLYQKKTVSLFIQTDKPVYKPGDKVQFRAFALFPNYKVFQDLLDVTILDPCSNKVQQWLNDTQQVDGLVSGDFTLPFRPLFGKWQIHVTADGQSSKKSFMVLEYAKPLFEVMVKLPSYVLQSEKDVVFYVLAKFSTGKPVEGRVQILASLIQDGMTDEEIKNVTAFLDIDLPFTQGQSQIAIPMLQIERAAQDLNNQTLFVKSIVTEAMTGKMYCGNNTVRFPVTEEVLSFPIMNAPRFKPSLDYTVYLKLSRPDGRPLTGIKDKGVRITTRLSILDMDGPPPTLSSNKAESLPVPVVEKDLEGIYKTIPVDGIISFQVVPDRKAIAMEIMAYYGDATATLKVLSSYSPSYSFIQLYPGEMKNYVVGDIMEFVVKATDKLEYFTYQVLSKGLLIHSERQSGQHSNTTRFYVTATVDMIPSVRIIVFHTRADGEIVADSYHVEIQGNFPNEVQLTINDNSIEPNRQMVIYTIADPGGRVYLHAIDQRVHYKNSLSEITREKLYYGLDVFDPMRYSQSFDPTAKYSHYADSSSDKDAYETFWGSGLIVMTDHRFYRYHSPYERKFSKRPNNTPTSGGKIDGLVEESSFFRFGRLWTHFPESWLWTDIEVCANGEAVYFVKVPETVTTWVLNGFSINKESGFGMPLGPTQLTVMKPFFFVVVFPKFDIILGEEVGLEVIVFNDMQMDQKIMITLPKNAAFMNLYRDCNGGDYKIQQDQIVFVKVRSGRTASVYFPIVPLIMGVIEIHVRVQTPWAADGTSEHIKVVAPGSAFDYNIPVYIDLTGDKRKFISRFNISLPHNVVKESTLMKVSAFGDLLGPSIVGLSSLLEIPLGCGEQTLLGMASDLYAAEYLQYTNQLYGAVKEKAYEYMAIGYQQELTFKHRDGSFSAFGNQDDSGSMWLTAFVARVFHQASYHIFIDKDIIKQAIHWMIQYQHDNGSFPEPGRVVDKHIQSKYGTTPSLSAFVLLALNENEDLFDSTSRIGIAFHDAKTKCLSYLESQVASQSDLYFLSLASFVLKIAESNDTEFLMDRLVARAVRRDDFVYWHHSDSHKAKVGSWHKPNPSTAIDVEMTSYILATVALRGEIHLGRKIFNWLLGQRNTHGSFYSSQDPIVAFMAMGLFAQLVYTDHINIKTQIILDTGEEYKFNINKQNALTMQRRETNKIPSSVKVEASGKGLAVVELSLYFNVESEIQDTSFELNFKLVTETKYFLYMETCTRWLGEGEASGMAVQEIGIPSGFEPDRDTIPKLDTLKKIEVENKKLILYFDEVSSDFVCIRLGLNRTGLVGKNKPSVIKIYDYFEPTNQITYFYKSKVLEDVRMCDLCPFCHNCEKIKSKKRPPTILDEDIAIESEINKD